MDTKPDSMDVQVGVVAGIVGLGVLWLATRKKSDEPPPPGGDALISGVVSNAQTGQALIAATVTLSAGTQSVTATTDSLGRYAFHLVQDPLATTPLIGATIHWAASKTGFITEEGDIVVAATQVIDIALTPEPPPIGPAFIYSNVAITTWTDYARLGDWLGPLFTCTIRNASTQVVTHSVKMMWRRTYNGALDYGPAQAYSDPSSLTLNAGQSFSFTCDGWNPVRAAMDILIVPRQYSAGVVYYFWLEDEAGHKSPEVSF